LESLKSGWGKQVFEDARRDGKKSPLFSNANNIHFKNSEPKKSCEFSKKEVKFFWYQVDKESIKRFLLFEDKYSREIVNRGKGFYDSWHQK